MEQTEIQIITFYKGEKPSLRKMKLIKQTRHAKYVQKKLSIHHKHTNKGLKLNTHIPYSSFPSLNNLNH